MNSKLIIGTPLAFIAVVMAYNYINSPPVHFDNILGSYDAAGGPYEGCIVLHQPGAGIKVTGELAGTDTLAGQMDGSTFHFGYSIADHSGTAALDVHQPTISGEWVGTDAAGQAETGTWVFTKRDTACT